MIKHHRSILQKTYSPFVLLITTIGVAYSYVFLEWLFLVTKPSFMSVLEKIDKLKILFYSGAFLSTISIILTIPSLLVNSFSKKNCWKFFSSITGGLVPTTIFSSLVLLLVDNFSYTVFNFGIISTTGIIRVFYGAIFPIVVYFLLIEVVKFTKFIEYNILEKNNGLKIFTKPIILFIISLLSAITILLPYQFIKHKKEQNIVTITNNADSTTQPHIFLFTCESCDAENMSLYGYERNTTPFLKELAHNSLLSMNSFSNAQGTTGAITSILTGKYPMDTRVIYAPGILRGEDSYQHLPGILMSNGYYTVQLSFNWYADAYDLNFIHGFSEVNGRHEKTTGFLNLTRKILPTNYAYFAFETVNRITNRLGHIYFFKDMENPFEQVTEPTLTLGFNDDTKLKDMINLLDKIDQPLFIHRHWMVTHGPRYYPNKQVFSAGKALETQENYDVDLYDDSILEFDNAMSFFFSELEIRELINKSIVVIASDHSKSWTKSRLPLLIHFPNSEYKKRIIENTQHIDIGPTLLDYLGINQPDWMPGRSLLSNLEAEYPIFISSVGQTTIDESTNKRIHTTPTEPFYQFGRISVIVCDSWFEIDLINYLSLNGDVDNYYGECFNNESSGVDIFAMIIAHLQENKYDTSSLDSINNKSEKN